MASNPGRTSAAWLLYFLATIALVGSTLGYAVSGPFYLLGRIFPAAHHVAGRRLRFAIAVLMRLQPWLDSRVDIRWRKHALLVSNHRSHLDAFLLLSRIPNIRMVCKSELLRIPFLGLMMRAMRQIPVTRKDSASYYRAMEQLRTGIRAGDTVHVFAEMTRCEPGTGGTSPFHLMPFRVAFEERAPVIPVVFRGTDAAWPKGSFGLRFRTPVDVVTLPAVDPADFPSAAELAAGVRRRIDAALAEPIRQSYARSAAFPRECPA